MNERTNTFIDRLMDPLDQAVRTIFSPAPRAERANPATRMGPSELTESDRELAGRLMRINHVGEICAQALYQGQALTAMTGEVKIKMEQAAREENDHLAWTEARIHELGSHRSYFNPIWYSGAFALGAIAGVAGDKWSLGFVAETEKQVVDHLSDHLSRLPLDDERSRAILEQMRKDESQHATVAIESGGVPLPDVAKRLMRFASKIMTRTAYWI